MTLLRRAIEALIFLSSAGGDLCILSSAHFLLFQVHSLQDESVSIHATSLWLQLEFVGNGPMSSGMDKAKQQGTLLSLSVKYMLH